jgi:Glycosyl hydrolases family 25/LGFP repeat
MKGFVPLIDLPVVPVPLPDLQGSFFTFTTANGPVTIYHHPAVGAHEVHGAILAAYLARNGPMGDLGYPLSDEYDDQVGGVITGRVSDFQTGSIFFDFATAQVSTLPVAPLGNVGIELIDGIDVSTFQGSIDWRRVSSLGTSQGEKIQFAYLKATEGDTGKDPRFTENWTGSKNMLPRGAYHFFHARKIVDATRVQADNFIATVLATGDMGELPLMVDVESLAAGITAAEAAASLQFFMSIVEQGTGSDRLFIHIPRSGITKWLITMRSTGFTCGLPTMGRSVPTAASRSGVRLQ